MKQFVAAVCIVLFLNATQVHAQEAITYEQRIEMIPMRDGVRLYTVIFTPEETNEKFPILLERTPYAAYRPPSYTPYASSMGKEGYIFVYQDIRGKHNSEGNMEIHTPLIHLSQPGAVDESTDTYDTIEWLVNNIKNNNGKAGITGISYPGWLAMVGTVNPHPALKAASPQAQMGDLFLGDDFYHNGAFRLSYGMEYTYMVENNRALSGISFPPYDLYDWYLELGSLKNVNEKYFHRRIPTWNRFIEHPNYDNFWQENSPLSYVTYPAVPMLHVGGYFDQEDMMGPQLFYRHLEKKDSFNRNYICLGPWFHGQWALSQADRLGSIAFESNTAEWFRELQQKWFNYWLKNKGDRIFSEAVSFQTGSNKWRTYKEWPPKTAISKKLYAGPGNSCSFTKPANTKASLSYVSDPAKPVPYRTPPIEATYANGSRWSTWLVEDQRFVCQRPDVISFSSEMLKDSIVVTGNITAHLTASSTGTDADWVVKLIDVYPDDEKSLTSGYQLPIAMEVFRGRFRNSFINPSPLVAGKAETFEIDLHDINHVFKKDHRLMIQIQSSWFPVIDRNPQKYVPNIFLAEEKDFMKATQTIYCNGLLSTYLVLPIMDE